MPFSTISKSEPSLEQALLFEGEDSNQALLNIMVALRVANAAGLTAGCGPVQHALLAECGSRGLDSAGAEADAKAALLAHLQGA